MGTEQRSSVVKLWKWPKEKKLKMIRLWCENKNNNDQIAPIGMCLNIFFLLSSFQMLVKT